MNRILDSLKRQNLADIHIDCIFGGNDRMTEGARQALEKYTQCHPESNHGNPASILYLGVDALPTPGGGIEKVRDGKLTVSAIYPTHGDEVMQLALNILKGNPYEKETMMETSLVTQANANVLLMQHKEVENQNAHIQRMHTRIDNVLFTMDLQRIIMLGTILIIALMAGFIVYVVRISRLRRALNRELRQKNQELNDEKAIVERQRDELEEQRDKLLDAVTPVKETSEPEAAQMEVRNEFMEKFNSCLDKHIADSDLSVEDIGDEMGFSRVQLYRKVKVSTGKTPVELIREERLRRAKVLLADSSLSISEVAYRVGFSAPSYFTKCYKDFYGKSPSDKN